MERGFFVNRISVPDRALTEESSSELNEGVNDLLFTRRFGDHLEQLSEMLNVVPPGQEAKEIEYGLVSKAAGSSTA